MKNYFKNILEAIMYTTSIMLGMIVVSGIIEYYLSTGNIEFAAGTGITAIILIITGMFWLIILGFVKEEEKNE